MKYLVVLLFVLPWSSPVSREGSSSPYRFSNQIEEAFARDTTAGRVDLAAYHFSYIGEYKQALAYFDKGASPRWVYPPKDSLLLHAYKPVPAREYILARALKKQIVIINEAHHNPLHRVFTASLLEGLYQAGFRYLGAETLGYADPGLNQRKYPTGQTGYYTQEPQYGNLIREALALGFTVFPYESGGPSPKEREIGQARNIQKVLQRNPKAKIIIHCGYSHAWEAAMGGDWEKAMAGRVKEFTGIDPFTIDQERWTEKSDPAKENPAYRMLRVNQPSVLVDQQGVAFTTLPNTTELTDIRVVHPRTTYRYGRPEWLLRDGKAKPFFLKKEQLNLGFPVLVLAYKANEPAEGRSALPPAVPVDVMELKAAGEQKALILPPGMYQLVVTNQGGQQQGFSIIH
ncbi:MAG: hypothetical protein ICV83_00025 [Cytophagales bacterium]|nr:hypothetical protein [Cytophagales bacterium]